MSAGEEPPAVRAANLGSDFEEAMAAMVSEGEPLNVLVSREVRESLEMYLKQSAEVIIEAENGHILSEIVIQTAADALPHLRRGIVRDALSYYIEQRSPSEEPETVIGKPDNDAGD